MPRLEPTYAPRGLKRDEAARYLGVSPSKFDQMVKDGRMPLPREIDACRVWDRMSLDAAFEELPVHGQSATNPFDGVAA